MGPPVPTIDAVTLARGWRVFYCFNQVSYVIARAEVHAAAGERTCIVYYPKRIRPSEVRRLDRAYPHSRSIGLCLFLASLISSRIEVVLPHPKGGRFVRWMARWARRVAWIDDGMDSFRAEPRNIETLLLRPGFTFYALAHSLPLAGWLSGADVRRRCGFDALTDDGRPTIDLASFDVLFVESPGVRLDVAAWGGRSVAYLVHPNVGKQGVVPESCVRLVGRDINIERALAGFRGLLLVGESMLAIFAIQQADRQYRIELHLSRTQHANLSCLHPAFEQTEGLCVRLTD